MGIREIYEKKQNIKDMTTKLFFQALTKFLAGLVLVGALLFVSAGTFAYWQGWLFIALLFGPMLIAGVVLMLRQPELLRKRLDAKEKQGEQKWVVALSGLMFLAMFVVAGLNYRFQWCLLPNWAVYAASVVFLIGYALYAEVLRENVWLSRTIEVQEHQKVVKRIRNEEVVLEQGLEGYTEYKQKVRYKVIPFVW